MSTPTTIDLADKRPILDVVDDENAAALVPAPNQGDTTRASWNISLHQLRANLAHCSAEGREAFVGAFMWCIDPEHPVHRIEFAKRIGYDQTTIWKIMFGKYLSPDKTLLDVPRKLIAAIHHFIKLERARFSGGKTDFVLTPTARRISTMCELARESQTPAFVWGHSHCGKTWALRQHVSENNHGRSSLCRVPAACGLGGFVRAWAASVGVSDNGNTQNLIRYIKRAITPDMLVCLDEVHQLSYTYRKESFFAALEVIREVYDETQCGMVLSGTSLLMERLEGSRHKELEQLFNRGTHRLNLMNAPTRGDLEKIIEHWKLPFPSPHDVVVVVPKEGKNPEVTDRPYEVLRQLSTTTRLKAITERLRYGRKLAQNAKEDFSWRHFLHAHHIFKRQGDDQESDW